MFLGSRRIAVLLLAAVLACQHARLAATPTLSVSLLTPAQIESLSTPSGFFTRNLTSASILRVVFILSGLSSAWHSTHSADMRHFQEAGALGVLMAQAAETTWRKKREASTG